MMLRTAQQQKTLLKDCGVARVAHILGDSCSILILRDLLETPRRFGELQESLKGISTRTLTNKLRFLEEEGLIAHAASSPTYELTQKGAGLDQIIESMRAYGKKYL
jgi:DNA-binding HxlR family transcriptional regulator